MEDVKKRDIERLSKIGLCTSERSVQLKLSSWMDFLDLEIQEIKKGWIEGNPVKYQIIGDNWDKNILPSYRTTQNKTISLHLFNAIVVVDRITPLVHVDDNYRNLEPADFIPSTQEQELLLKELAFIVATSLISNLDQLQEVFEAIYPKHLQHKYSNQVGEKTKQFPIGLFDCNETKTAEVIRLLKYMTEKYVPVQDGKMVEEVFFGGDRLTDEKIQGAQQAMRNAATELQRLEGFISKIEDWHRMVNFMEAICKLTYNTTSQRDRGTAHYFRNMLNARNVKGEVKNSFRAYKHLYYSIFDGICCILFLNEFGVHNLEEEVEFPTDFHQKSDLDKVSWLNDVCETIVKKWFFEDSDDICQEIRDVFENPDHEENYYVVNANDGRFPCHFCEKSFSYVGSLKSHEQIKHQHTVQPMKRKPTVKNTEDELYNYMCLLFKLTALLKNLDTAIDMADGHRSVRSCKYELPIFHKTHKTKYVIGCIHLTTLTEEILPEQQRERLISNRCVNIQGGTNRNIALDECLEMLNRDSKDIAKGNQTKESIISHSKQYPH
ncbi:uncharacterized protein LOC125660287 [Ostrea edulis]|uniref:uncharacterized protein LOC125660287 n=1 Tax=Ostrea edulis TaxID=37623 RepID=UPI0024AED81D|nr:uncharacterized protein LOC125660287 [Ostrea edulis]